MFHIQLFSHLYKHEEISLKKMERLFEIFTCELMIINNQSVASNFI